MHRENPIGGDEASEVLPVLASIVSGTGLGWPGGAGTKSVTLARGHIVFP